MRHRRTVRVPCEGVCAVFLFIQLWRHARLVAGKRHLSLDEPYIGLWTQSSEPNGATQTTRHLWLQVGGACEYESRSRSQTGARVLQ